MLPIAVCNQGNILLCRHRNRFAKLSKIPQLECMHIDIGCRHPGSPYVFEFIATGWGFHPPVWDYAPTVSATHLASKCRWKRLQMHLRHSSCGAPSLQLGFWPVYSGGDASKQCSRSLDVAKLKNRTHRGTC